MFRMLSLGQAANGLDIVAVWIEHESSIVVCMVVWAYSGRPIVPAAGCNRFLIKSIDGRSVRRGEGDMRSRLTGVSSPNPEESLGTNSIAREPFTFRI